MKEQSDTATHPVENIVVGGGGGARAAEGRGTANAVRGWLARWWRALLTEFLGTALLMFISTMAQVPRALPPPAAAPAPLDEAPLAHFAIAFGIMSLAVAHAFGRISGGFVNPALSVAAAVAGRVTWPLACAYALAQTVGATLGFYCIRCVFPDDASVRDLPFVESPAPSARISDLQACALEAALTGMLALLWCAWWRPRQFESNAPPPAPHPEPNADTAAPVKVGLVVTGLVFAGGWITGVTANPARGFAPAIINNRWQQQWAYWVGSMLGAAAGAALYRYVLVPVPQAQHLGHPPPR